MSRNDSTQPVLNHNKLYKLKSSLEKTESVETTHSSCLNSDTSYFDHYLDYAPSEIKRLFQICFCFNRIFMLALTYCVLYNTVWWFDRNNKLTSKSITFISLAINYTIIDKKLLLIIIYFNFHELLIETSLLRIALFNILKMIRVTSTIKLKSILNQFHMGIKLTFIFIFFVFFKYSLSYSTLLACIILMPHVCLLVYFNYDYEISLFNGLILMTNNLNLILFVHKRNTAVLLDPSSQRWVTSQEFALKRVSFVLLLNH
jgi:hypothetical protein